MRLPDARVARRRVTLGRTGEGGPWRSPSAAETSSSPAIRARDGPGSPDSCASNSPSSGPLKNAKPAWHLLNSLHCS